MWNRKSKRANFNDETKKHENKKLFSGSFNVANQEPHNNNNTYVLLLL
jgi:hypothetical protein